MNERSMSACFTGHRPNKIGGYDESNAVMQRVKFELSRAIKSAVGDGYTTFISGMALGVDMVAAELVLEYRDMLGVPIRLVAAVPFEGQERKWPDKSQERWRNIIARSDDLIYVCGGGYAPWKMQRRNEWMVDNSSLVIAVWDGTDGGTGNCVKYAESKGANIVRIDPKE